MVQITGTYQHDKNENFVEYLLAIGTPENKAQKAESIRPKLQISVDGKKVTLNNEYGGEKTTTTFILDEEVDEPIPDNIVLKSTAKLAGDTLTITSKSPNGNEGSRVYKASDSGLVVILGGAADGSTAKRYYKRI